MRKAQISRKTNETDIKLTLALDGVGQAKINTGLGFLDHMLTQVAVHGIFDLTLEAKGDLHIDAHHTVEDTALALGKAFDNALTDRKGIARMASCCVPMDEALAQITLDFSGRPYCVLSTCWSAPSVGNIPTSLIEHFFESFTVSSRSTLHAQVFYGRDNHHMAEALFKAFGRALDTASQLDPRRAGEIPSSKGTL